MYPEIVNGKLDDSYIDIFLGLLLKLGQLREDDYSYMFGKDLNSHNINLQTQKIRELYKKEVLKLKYAGKNANQSKLPWISKAKKLFENTIDWGAMEEQKTASSSEDSPMEIANANSSNLHCSLEKSSSIPPPPQMPSAQSDTIKLPCAYILLVPPIAKNLLSPIAKESDDDSLFKGAEAGSKQNTSKSKDFIVDDMRFFLPSTFMCLFPPVREDQLSPSTKD